MNKKFLSLGIGILFLGVVSASGVIDNFNLDFSDGNLHGGETGEIGFSFDFNERVENSPDSSLVLRFNISSLNEDYPVWKGDFDLDGLIVEETNFPFTQMPLPFFEETYPLKCVNNYFAPKTERGILYEEEIVNNGTFYCYDPNNYLDMLKLDRSDFGVLEFTPHNMIYPGDYNFSLELMEVEKDFEPPFVEFLTEGDYYNSEDDVMIKFNVSDLYNIYEVKYKISNNLLDQYYNSGWIDCEYNSESGLYEDSFSFEENELNMSGDYYIWAWACDMLGNCREM